MSFDTDPNKPLICSAAEKASLVGAALAFVPLRTNVASVNAHREIRSPRIRTVSLNLCIEIFTTGFSKSTITRTHRPLLAQNFLPTPYKTHGCGGVIFTRYTREPPTDIGSKIETRSVDNSPIWKFVNSSHVEDDGDVL